MKKRVTLSDIAKELNITVSAVSKALSNHPLISDSTKEAVKKTVERLNYRHNKIARSLQSGKSQIIGVIIPSAEKSFFGSVVHGIEKIMNKHGYNVLLYQSSESEDHEAKGIETFLESDVDGIIASIAKETTHFEHYLEVKNKNIPLILFDRVNEDLGFPSVTIDDYKGAYLATEHLIKQGYKRIAHIAGLQHIKIFNDRLRGYLDALKKYNMEISSDFIAYGKNSIESGRSCMDQLLKFDKRPDAVFAVEDFTALGAIKSLKNHSISVPNEIGIIGFANEAFGEYITPSLSTVDQKTIQMGEEAATLFLEIIKNKNIYNGLPIKKVLEPRIIKRESSNFK